MRYISIDRVKEGMVSAKPFYGRKGEILLRGDITLTGNSIKRIKELQYPGIYIKDDFSEGAVGKEVINDELRRTACVEYSRLIAGVESGQTMEVQLRLRNLSKTVDEILDEVLTNNLPFLNYIDLKEYDYYNSQHAVNVCVLACVVGAALQLAREPLFNLALAGMLHDIGIATLDKEILNKTGKLTPKELLTVRSHSKNGYDILKKYASLMSAVTVSVLQHHEKFNGEGYPNKASGAEITPNAHIIAIADVFDAMTSPRPYRKMLPASEAYAYILSEAEQSFHPDYVGVFTGKVAPYPLGFPVLLSNDMTGIVFENYGDHLTRPLIRLDPKPGLPKDAFLDLRKDPKITIKKVLLDA